MVIKHRLIENEINPIKIRTCRGVKTHTTLQIF
jgi:hypothetical protein